MGQFSRFHDPDDSARIGGGAQPAWSLDALHVPDQRTVETFSLPDLRGSAVTAEITRVDGAVSCIQLFQEHRPDSPGAGFTIEIVERALAEQLGTLPEPYSLGQMISVIEEAQGRDGHSCSVIPRHQEDSILKELVRTALLGGSARAAINQSRSLAEFLTGSERRLELIARAVPQSSVLVLSVETFASTDGVLEATIRLRAGEHDLVRLGRRAENPAESHTLSMLLGSMIRTFELTEPLRYVEYSQQFQGLLVPCDPSAVAPRFLYGHALQDRIVDVDPQVVLSRKELLRMENISASTEVIAFSPRTKEGPCAALTFAVDGASCHSINLVFDDHARIVILSGSWQPLFRGDIAGLDKFVTQTLESFLQNPFSLIIPHARYLVQGSGATLSATLGMEKLGRACIAYHLWHRDREGMQYFPAEFGHIFSEPEKALSVSEVVLLKGQPISLRMHLSHRGITSVEIFEQRSFLSRFLAGDSYVLRGAYALKDQESLHETEEIFNGAMERTVSLMGAGLGWYPDNSLDVYMRGLCR